MQCEVVKTRIPRLSFGQLVVVVVVVLLSLLDKSAAVAVVCEDLDDCVPCTQNPMCGWCQNDSNSSGSCIGSGQAASQCSTEDFILLTEQCQATIQPDQDSIAVNDGQTHQQNNINNDNNKQVNDSESTSNQLIQQQQKPAKQSKQQQQSIRSEDESSSVKPSTIRYISNAQQTTQSDKRQSNSSPATSLQQQQPTPASQQPNSPASDQLLSDSSDSNVVDSDDSKTEQRDESLHNGDNEEDSDKKKKAIHSDTEDVEMQSDLQNAIFSSLARQVQRRSGSRCDEVNCSELQGCEECALSRCCGFCSVKQQCVAKSSGGKAKSGECPSSFITSAAACGTQLADLCSSKSTCFQCTAVLQCAWCNEAAEGESKCWPKLSNTRQQQLSFENAQSNTQCRNSDWIIADPQCPGFGLAFQYKANYDQHSEQTVTSFSTLMILIVLLLLSIALIVYLASPYSRLYQLSEVTSTLLCSGVTEFSCSQLFKVNPPSLFLSFFQAPRHRMHLVALMFASWILTLIALILNQWSLASNSQLNVAYGTINQSHDGRVFQYPLCHSLAGANVERCMIARASGVFVFVLSCASFLLLNCALIVVQRRMFKQYLFEPNLLYWLTLSCITQITATAIWLTTTHSTFKHYFQTDIPIQVGLSFWLSVCSSVLLSLLVFVFCCYFALMARGNLSSTSLIQSPQQAANTMPEFGFESHEELNRIVMAAMKEQQEEEQELIQLNSQQQSNHAQAQHLYDNNKTNYKNNSKTKQGHQPLEFDADAEAELESQFNTESLSRQQSLSQHRKQQLQQHKSTPKKTKKLRLPDTDDDDDDDKR